MRRITFLFSLSLLCVGFLVAADSGAITVRLDGHVKKPGSYLVERRVGQNLNDLIRMAGGFDPLAEFKDETTSSVVWIERDSAEAPNQHIIIDYKNRQILSQRRGEGKSGGWSATTGTVSNTCPATFCS